MAYSPNRNSVYRNIVNRETVGALGHSNLIASCKNSFDLVQRLGLFKNFNVHNGCVNSICWNKTGEYILSASDDQHVSITNPYTNQVLLRYRTSHHSNIFSARFLPQSNDMNIVTCSGDGVVLHTELLQPYLHRCPRNPFQTEVVQENWPTYEPGEPKATVNSFNCHRNGTAYEILTIPTDPKCFLSCGEDGTVRFFDLRTTSSCHKTCCKDNILIMSPAAANSMDLSPQTNVHLAVGSSDGVIRIYDRRFLTHGGCTDDKSPLEKRFTYALKTYSIPSTLKRQFRVTSVKFNQQETHLLGNFSSEYLYLFDLLKNGQPIELIRSQVCPTDEEKWGRPTPNVEQVTRRLRLRGDWSDTGPQARPDDPTGGIRLGQVRPQLQASIMNRMTQVISRMLNDPRTRMGAGGNVNEVQQNEYRPQNSSSRQRSNSWRIAAYRSITRTANRNQLFGENQALSTGQRQDGPSTSRESETVTNNEDNAGDIDEDIPEDIMEDFSYLLMKFEGHRNARTMIKEAIFWGDNYVMSGSDCGHIFVWDRWTGKVIKTMVADRHVVNCLQPHPVLPYLASSGIDYDIKLWAPTLEKSDFDEKYVADLIKLNKVMLEQTKDTITVPAAFMIRMLACIHSLRNRSGPSGNEDDGDIDGGSINESNADDDEVISSVEQNEESETNGAIDDDD